MRIIQYAYVSLLNNAFFEIFGQVSADFGGYQLNGNYYNATSLYGLVMTC